MQNANKNQLSRSMTHPDETEWMDFLYDEVSPARKLELQEHLKICASCAGQVHAWRKGMDFLDAYRIPVIETHRKSHFAPVLRWAAAVAVILAMGFILGRATSNSDRQIRELQASVTRLEQASTSPYAGAQSPAILAAATETAQEETVRLLKEYTRMASLEKAQERQATALALRTLEAEYVKLRSGLETLAVNTEDGLHLTHQNLVRLAAYSTSQPGN